MPIDDPPLRAIKARLARAIERGCSTKWSLRLWARFVKARDGHRCVNCSGTENIQAHHIFRRTTYPFGMLELGNGITLCGDCHKKIHAEFNGRPLMAEPINARGGDDLDEIAYLYGILYEDAQKRQVDQDEFYYIADHMLIFFVKCQGYGDYYELAKSGGISRIRLAHEIWRAMPEVWYTNVVEKLVSGNL